MHELQVWEARDLLAEKKAGLSAGAAIALKSLSELYSGIVTSSWSFESANYTKIYNWARAIAQSRFRWDRVSRQIRLPDFPFESQRAAFIRLVKSVLIRMFGND